MVTAFNAELVWIAIPVLLVAWVNGANDVSKGVATLIGSGASDARTAIAWGALWTVLGGLTAVVWGAGLVSTFSSGFLAPGFPATRVFAIGALTGAFAWVLLATHRGWPVSTTHALLGGIVGAALMTAGPAGLRLTAVAHKALLPLLLSPVFAIVLCWTLLSMARWVARRVPAWRPGCCDPADWRRDPYVCAPGSAPARPVVRRLWVALHWLSSGATSFARGLNDVPKIAAFLIVALAAGSTGGAGPSAEFAVIGLVTLTMGLGSLWGGFRVAEVLAHRVTTMDPRQGLVANLGTALLVLAASPLGLPVSTTHVSTGALMGIRWAESQPPARSDALGAILFAWFVTLPVAAGLAALAIRLCPTL
ncbi:MAG: inorganic phosphate transporter [Gammaproteobacteria bacterium]